MMRMAVETFVEKEKLNLIDVLQFLSVAVTRNLQGHVFTMPDQKLELDTYAVDFLKEYYKKKHKYENIEYISYMENKIIQSTNDLIMEDSYIEKVNDDTREMKKEDLLEIKLEDANKNISSLQRVISEQSKLIDKLNNALEKDAVTIAKLQQVILSLQVELDVYENSILSNIKKKIGGTICA